MKLKTMSLTNFGSYANLEHDFSDSGLTLVFGATGSGKSTLMDAPLWITTGLTAKASTADGVRSWTAPESPTTGILTLMVGSQEITVTRIRGKSTENDLFFQSGKNDPIRGKDMTDTQKLINEVLGVDDYLYTLGAYYNEFSPTASFFTDKASKRREMFEQLADLSLPTTLSVKIKDAKSLTKKALTVINGKLSNTEGRLEQIKRTETSSAKLANTWEDEHFTKIQAVIAKDNAFEEDKADRIAAQAALEEVFEHKRDTELLEIVRKIVLLQQTLVENCAECSECGTPNRAHAKASNDLSIAQMQKTTLEQKTNPHIENQVRIENEKNPYGYQIERLSSEDNPFVQQIADLREEKHQIVSTLEDTRQTRDAEQHRYDSLEQLSSLCDTLRGELLKQSVNNIETETNRYLDSYFDAEIRVEFEVSGGDKLNVSVSKSGYSCDYKQLSKGQRGLLKLSFSTAIMSAASNRAGVHFDTVMYDEALDGYDSNMKLKAYNLFCEAAKKHSTVMVIDHSPELHNLFENRLLVTIDQDRSTIEVV